MAINTAIRNRTVLDELAYRQQQQAEEAYQAYQAYQRAQGMQNTANNYTYGLGQPSSGVIITTTGTSGPEFLRGDGGWISPAEMDARRLLQQQMTQPQQAKVPPQLKVVAPPRDPTLPPLIELDVDW